MRYVDKCYNKTAKEGDVVYMASNPELKMVVQELVNYNYAANHSSPEVIVAWMTADCSDIKTARVYADILEAV